MQNILEYSFLSWFQFAILAVAAALLLVIANSFHLFKRHSWTSSIGYHMFFCMVLSIVVIGFLAINPFFHFLLLLVIFGFIYKNIIAYVRSVFNLYFSNIHMGDKVRLGDTEGRLINVNLGGMHISSKNEKTFYPFNNWNGGHIVLLSEAGKVPLSITVEDAQGRKDEHAIYELEKSLFEFPYLSDDKIEIHSEGDDHTAKSTLCSKKYKGSMIKNIERAGFNTNNTKSN